MIDCFVAGRVVQLMHFELVKLSDEFPSLEEIIDSELI